MPVALLVVGALMGILAYLTHAAGADGWPGPAALAVVLLGVGSVAALRWWRGVRGSRG